MDPHITQWHFVVDNLNTHQSESLVRFVAAESDLDIGLGILARKLLKRGHFTSMADLRAKVLDFVAYFNPTMAKPFR